MLVLSRKQTEGICISDNVVVTVLSIRGNKVKIGIEAPAEMPVHRKEIYATLEKASVVTHGAFNTTGNSH